MGKVEKTTKVRRLLCHPEKGIVRVKVLSLENPNVIRGVLRYENVNSEEQLMRSIEAEKDLIAEYYDVDVDNLILMRAY